ncbi:MAG TPA: polysaccharide deacetylase family protein [Bacteroidales bacterium]|nr:polysaccharide deacetylase family protein [Bacteroidales bacterium]
MNRQIPAFIHSLFPGITWRIPGPGKKIYLTFDDGPTPGITEEVLSLLEEFNASATFFCTGKQVQKHPDLFLKIREKGHAVGNHSFSHPDGFRSSPKKYVADVLKAAELIQSSFFRPPFGRMKPGQFKMLRREFSVIMWSVMAYDFNPENTPEDCFRLVRQNCKPGSIIVFHDTKQASGNLFDTLRLTLAHFTARGYAFPALLPGLVS